MPAILQLLFGLILSALIGAFAYARGSLTRSGVLGAVLTGTAIFGFGGFIHGVLLVAFFVSSSILSHYRARAKAPLAEKFQKGSRRDLGQAFANGGWAALLAIAFGFSHSPLLFAAYVGAIAAVTADTWATEIGVLNPQPPRLITTGNAVSIGTSGGVTRLGTLTALGGGFFIGIAAALSGLMLAAWDALVVAHFIGAPNLLARLDAATLLGIPLIAGVSGLAGSLFDSLLGATVQAIYFCEYDQKETERRIHSCGRATRRVRGWAWLDNDAVNFFTSIFGSAAAVLLWVLIY